MFVNVKKITEKRRKEGTGVGNFNRFQVDPLLPKLQLRLFTTNSREKEKKTTTKFLRKTDDNKTFPL